MTQKELLYIEDTLGHLKTMEQLLLNAKSNLEDANLKQFVGKQLTKTRQQYNEIFKLLGWHMQDQFLMTQLLDESKSICNLLNNGTLEADDSVLQSCFKKVLTNYLSLQHEIYKSMQEMGWYPMENVKQQAIDKVKKKFEEKKEK